MSFLKKMFGPKDPVEEMQQCHARQDWAGVLLAAKQIKRDEKDSATQAQIIAWEDAAGDALATINIEEGLWAQQAGNLLRAREDFQLAIEQARSEALRIRAEQALAALERGEPATETIGTDDGPALHTGCNSCTPAPQAAVGTQGLELDEETRMELLLATMPAPLAERYLKSGQEFKQAWLASQDGNAEQALALLDKVPAAERNALYLLERGSLLARSGQHQPARQDLQAALTVEPDLFPAFDALAEVLIAAGRIDELGQALKQNIAAERFVGYCWARLAELHAQRNELEPALAAGLKAVEQGIKDPGLVVLCAQLLERAERFDEAESLLMQLPGGGCGGGVHPMLAEYWMRRGQNLDKALESFKGALRQERDNPRWLLRISQVYLAKGWRKEAAEQVGRLMQQSDLPEQIRVELKAVADQMQRV